MALLHHSTYLLGRNNFLSNCNKTEKFDCSAALRISAGAETIVTTDQAVRGGKLIELKGVVDKAVDVCPKVKRVFVSKRTGANVPISSIDISFEEVLFIFITII